ncbi:MAG: YbhB/YbcL family Raf kinase inhibitor-like protein [Smithellaceae bacterium]|nr:YbhB/YbcL family Raf kinase inhibitor-like protein [Smithellaceae bacterium]
MFLRDEWFSNVERRRAMLIDSPLFEQGALIPPRFTCDGQDISPPLHWGDVPAAAQSLALIVDDPDAPVGTWVHWVVYNIPPSSSGMPEHVEKVKELADGTRQGKNDWPKLGYDGPCPPSGTHRYFFKLYALDWKLPLAAGATKAELLREMKGHILAEAELMGRYKRQGR